MKVRGEWHDPGNGYIRFTVDGPRAVVSVDGKTLVGKDPRGRGVVVVAKQAAWVMTGDAVPAAVERDGLLGDEVDPLVVRRALRGADDVWVRFER